MLSKVIETYFCSVLNRQRYHNLFNFIMCQVPRVLHTRISPRRRCYNYPYFMNKEAKTWKSNINCARSQWQESHPNPGLCDSKDLEHFCTALILTQLKCFLSSPYPPPSLSFFCSISSFISCSSSSFIILPSPQ